MTAASEIVAALPRVLRLRFERLAGFVTSILEERDPRYKDRLTREEIALVQLFALVYSLDRFFRDGTKAATAASALFTELGAGGFQVGREMFTPTSESTHRGRFLADELRTSLEGTRYLKLIDSARSLRWLVHALAGEVRHGRNLD